ncbi:MAG: DUF4139 domain-containing protein [Treponema sp.]|nr:DUF4139 domain-containing protein [Treponema sp.]
MKWSWTLLGLFLLGFSLEAQAIRELSRPTLPLRRISLYSSGVGYFEHGGTLSGPADIDLAFDAEGVNDVLASLVLHDPASRSPSLIYDAEGGLWRRLRSLRVDLSGNPTMAEIFLSQRGQEVELDTGELIRGRILTLEYRQQGHITPFGNSLPQPYLGLLTAQGIRSIPVDEIISFRFSDPAINADLNLALELLSDSRDSSVRNFRLRLDGTGSRPVSLSYILPTAVWKVSYRLDLSGPQPFLQGWAIIDNDSDSPWENVELSLVSGRPVSFIQQLYPPYRVFRPTLPLAIAGTADAVTHTSGVAPAAAPRVQSEMMMMEDSILFARSRSAEADQGREVLGGGQLQTAQAQAAGDQFEFTLPYPVNMGGRQGAMFPLVQGNLEAQRTLVFSGPRAVSSRSTIHPHISVELHNTLGLALPAGPITVFDGGTYGGDALMDFLPENDRRLISYGEDLSVTGFVSSSGLRYITGVTVSGGVMTISRRQSYDWDYTLRNASGEQKRLIIEHGITQGTLLVSPESYDERTSDLYRFNLSLPPMETVTYRVREEIPLSERITLSQIGPEAFLSLSTNQEISAEVRNALTRAIELRRAADQLDSQHRDLTAQMSRLTAEQGRIRSNLEAVGPGLPLSEEYLRRMSQLDSEIDELNSRISRALDEARGARRVYEDYVQTINF